jgi:AhpC/TSA family
MKTPFRKIIFFIGILCIPTLTYSLEPSTGQEVTIRIKYLNKITDDAEYSIRISRLDYSLQRDKTFERLTVPIPVDTKFAEVKISISEPRYFDFQLLFKGSVMVKEITIPVYKENVELTFDGRMYGACALSGGEDVITISEYNSIIAEFKVANESNRNARKNASTDEEKKMLDNQYQLLGEIYEEKAVAFLKSKRITLSLLLLTAQLNRDRYFDFIEQTMQSGIKIYPESEQVKKLYRDVYESFKLVSVGQSAPDVIFKDKNNRDVPLSSFRGKYVFLYITNDRFQRQMLEALQTKFGESSFKVIYVFIVDNDIEMYNGGDNLSSEQIVEQTKQSKVSLYFDPYSNKKNQYLATSAFNLSQIPYAILLDKQGKIIARGMNTLLPELERKISNLILK